MSLAVFLDGVVVLRNDQVIRPPYSQRLGALISQKCDCPGSGIKLGLGIQHMDLLSLVKFVIDLLPKVIVAVVNRQKPLVAQARRLISVFKAHGVGQLQIAVLKDLMGGPVKPEYGAFDSAAKLGENLTSEFLTWTCKTLAIRRSWLDGQDARVHETIDAYGNLRSFIAWAQCQSRTNHPALLHVVILNKWSDPSHVSGEICLILEECFVEMDEKAVSCYFGVEFVEHIKGDVDVGYLLAVMAIAESCGISLVGRSVRGKQMKKIKKGNEFLPIILAKSEIFYDIRDWIPIGYQVSRCMSIGHEKSWKHAISLVKQQDANAMLKIF